MDTYPYPADVKYVATLLLTPGTIIRRPTQIPGMRYENYDTLEILDGYGSGCWIAVARASSESHVYRLTHTPAQGLRAEWIRP
jgi:hypothetical protein